MHAIDGNMRKESDALNKIDAFVESLNSPRTKMAALSVNPLSKTHEDMPHALGMDMLLNVFTDLNAGDVTSYSSECARDEENKQLALLRQSLTKQKTRPAAKSELLTECYGLHRVPPAILQERTRRQLFSKPAADVKELTLLMQAEVNHRIQELFSVASGFNSIMNKKQIHALSQCVANQMGQEGTANTMIDAAAVEDALLHEDTTLTFEKFKHRFLKLRRKSCSNHAQDVAWIDAIYQDMLDSLSKNTNHIPEPSPAKPVTSQLPSPRSSRSPTSKPTKPRHFVAHEIVAPTTPRFHDFKRIDRASQ
ncbi:hypothetical protein AeMF1_003524 [Aphanomyces euteiches]|nr:hypothetical protein AeMF1_003524 [Aphanomyces euteiches]KAH9183314.1 hypothetical protein AeNC1_014711 [Aphanomyces euteiches]